MSMAVAEAAAAGLAVPRARTVRWPESPANPPAAHMSATAHMSAATHVSATTATPAAAALRKCGESRYQQQHCQKPDQPLHVPLLEGRSEWPAWRNRRAIRRPNATTAAQPVVRAGFCAATLAPGNATSLHDAQQDTAVRFSAQAWIRRRPNSANRLALALPS
jgi:hypothetical protein